MSKKSVFCTVSSPLHAYQIITCLKGEGFSNDDISVLFPDRPANHIGASEQPVPTLETGRAPASSEAPEKSNPSDVAPEQTSPTSGEGTYVAAGRVAASLGQTGEKELLRGVTRVLSDMGIPEFETGFYEKKVAEGSVLISVQPDTTDAAKRAWLLLKQAGAHDVLVAGTASMNFPPTHPGAASHVLLPVHGAG